MFCCVGIVHADSDILSVSYATPGFSGNEKDRFAPGGDGILPLSILTGSWRYEGCVEIQRRRSSGGIITANAYMPDPDHLEAHDSHDGVTFHLSPGEDSIYLDDYATLCFGITVDGVRGLEYPITVTVICENGILRSQVYATAGSWNLVTVDVREGGGALTALSVHTGFAFGTTPSNVRISEPYLAEELPLNISYAERYASANLTAETGRFFIRQGLVRPNANGMAYLSGSLNRPGFSDSGAALYFEIRVDGVTGGNMTLGVRYIGTETEQRVYSRKISLTSHDGIYTVPVEAHGAIASYSLQFDNITTESGNFTLTSVSVYESALVPLEGDNSIGSVSSITDTTNGVRFAGTMERAAVSDFSGARIGFYAIPGDTPSDLSEAIRLGSIKVSTRFEHTASLSGCPASADTWLFFAAIETGDELLLLSSPRYCDVSSAANARPAGAGLAHAAPVGAFESNITYVMVEIPLNQLLMGDSSGVVSSYTVYNEDGTSSARKLEFNRAMLNELDRDIQFYLSAGIRVYLRLMADAPIPNLTYHEYAETYTIHPADRAAREQYAAIIRFLAKRYSQAEGFVLGMSVNWGRYSGIGSLDTAQFSLELADLCRITYNAATDSIPGCAILVPFMEYASDGNAQHTWTSERTLALMLSDALSDLGRMPWSFLYCVDSMEDNLSPWTSLSRLLSDLEISGPESFMVYCEMAESTAQTSFRALPAAERSTFGSYIARQFGSFYENCRKARAAAVFLSLKNLSLTTDYDFYSVLKYAADGEGKVFEAEADSVSADARIPDGTSSVTVWDFSDKHYAMDWIAGGGVNSCVTTLSDRFSHAYGTPTRVLRSEIFRDGTADNGAAGITIRNLNNTVDLTSVDALSFTLSLNYADPATARRNERITLILVIGTEDRRAEYYAAAIPAGEIRQFVCDLSQYPYRSEVDFIGIVAHARDSVYLDLASVQMISRSMDEEELAKLFAPPTDPPASPFVSYGTLALLMLLTALLSVMVGILLSRRDQEEEALPQHTHPTNRKTNERQRL